MSKRELLTGIWLMSMALLSLFTFTVFFVAQMSPDILDIICPILAAVQCITLVIYLWGPEKLKSKPLKILYRLMYATSILVIPVFVFSFSGLVSQYHVRIPDSIDASDMPVQEILPADRTTVYNTGTVYVIFPEYSNVELVCEKRPSKSDTSITWCSGAAFQHTISLGFIQENVEGDHAVNGTLYHSPYNHDEFAAFVFHDGKYAFEFENPSEAIARAADAGGNGFMQFGLIKDGVTVTSFRRLRARCYRALAELNGNLCIIDSANMMHFDGFMDELRRLGVTNALYLDMGAGWNYSWYRNASEKVITLFGLPVPWSHNWVVFRK
ncbi:MAG: hypothetical protein IJ201_03620 [Solobacterium sp.]|nr:hypothetical protein [Solobacterium sp.]